MELVKRLNIGRICDIVFRQPTDHLSTSILSGFYGLLRPFDGVTPYRLEMQARLAVDGRRDLPLTY